MIPRLGGTWGLAIFYFYAVQRLRDPAHPIGLRAVVIVLILLNARQNLRQHRSAAVPEKLLH